MSPAASFLAFILQVSRIFIFFVNRNGGVEFSSELCAVEPCVILRFSLFINRYTTSPPSRLFALYLDIERFMAKLA